MAAEEIDPLTKSLYAYVQEVVKEAIKYFDELRKTDLWIGRRGGCLCIGDLDGNPILVENVEEVPEEKLSRYLTLCQEKARRLGAHPTHLSSFQSRVLENDQWGGAIKITVGKFQRILSFSGFPELGDEAVVCQAAYLFSIGMTQRQYNAVNETIDRIVVISENPYFDPFHAWMGGGI